MFRFRSIHAAHLSVIACLTLAPAAFAQTAEKPTAAQIKEAKRDASDAAKLIKQKKFDEALPKLQSAYAIDPKPATLAQIGTCQRELSQNVEAYATFEALLNHEKATAKDKKTAQKNLDELANLTGLLRVTVSEADAAVTLDGKPLTAETLAAAIRLNAGKHTIEAKKEGFEPFAKEVEIAGGSEAVVEAKLAAEVKTARIRIVEKNGNDVRVFIDGKEVGAAPWEGDLDPGSHVVEVRGATVASPKQTIDVAAKQKVELELDASVLQGSVKLTGTPENAIVLIDGNQVTLPFEGSLDVGTHRIEVSAPGFASVTREIVVTPDQPTYESFALEAIEAEEEGSSERFVKPGLLIGLGIPRPSGEIAVKLGDYLAVGGQYSMLPEISFPGVDAKLETSAIQGTLRVFPFGGAFYLGVGGGIQTLKASMTEGDISATTDLSSPVVTPQIGWLWMWDSGFTLGLSLGAQIPFGDDPDVTASFNGLPVPPAGTPVPAGIPQEKADKANDLRGKVNDAAKLVGKTPLPQIDLIKIGFFF